MISPKSRQVLFKFRYEHIGLLVGIQQYEDNPLLTIKRPRGGRNPIRIVMDTD